MPTQLISHDKSKVNYYRLKKILSTGARWLLIYGKRSNGKSYAVKEHVLTEAFKKGSQFILLRRWDVDIKQRELLLYFADLEDYIINMTSGAYNGIGCYHKTFYFMNTDETGNVINKSAPIGYALALTQAEHYKSSAYTDVDSVIYEEFLTDNYYLPDEPNRLMQLVSTIFRTRQGHVFMIGNTVSRVCPYIGEWGLRNILTQKAGTIDVYNIETDTGIVQIACEYCEPKEGGKSSLVFGRSAKQINHGDWDIKQMPHLPKRRLTDYDILYTMVVEVSTFMFLCELLCDKETGACLWFVSPKTTEIKDNTRVITDKPDFDPLTTFGFIPISIQERQAFELFKHGKVAYSDNMTGTDFTQAIKQFKTI